MSEITGELAEWRDDDVWRSLARPQGAVGGTPGPAVPANDAAVTTLHSGLPLHWNDNDPLLPERGTNGQRYLAVKRLCDVAMALGGGILLGPLLLLVAAAIRLTSPGPALFTQERTGKGGRGFWIYKFRTMDAEGRVTWFGRILRRSSVDELPQLLNVLRGEMAIVGPRPHPVGMRAAGRRYDELVPYYDARHAAKPGLTGWAQCNGLRGPADDPALARARVDHDIAYIQNASLWLDLRIIGRTLRREFLTGSGS